MSLARLALRLAAYEALNPFATLASGPWPTIAGPNVFDSRIDPLQEAADLDAIEGKPLLIVYTEQDVASPYGTAKYPPDEQVVHLVVEIMIAAKGTVQLGNPDGTTTTYGTLEAPISDRQHEALLDLLEAQVRRVFDRRNRAPSSALLNLVLMEVHRIESVPQRADDRTTRMAARTITVTAKLKKEAWPTVPPDTAPTGLALLPDPLYSVALALDPTSTGGALCLSFAAQLQSGLAAEALVPLGSIVFMMPAGAASTMNDPLVSSVTLDP